MSEIDPVEYLLVGVDSFRQGCEVAHHLQRRHSQQAREHAHQFGELDHEIKLNNINVVADLVKICDNYCCGASLLDLQNV